MRDKNLIKKSLYFHLREWLVDGGFIIKITGEALGEVSTKIYRAAHDDWAFEDLENYPVTIYDNEDEVDLSNYSRNFIQGIITFDDDYSIKGAITADYTYLTPNLRESYPEEEEFKYIDLPLLVYGIAGSPMTSLKLGGDKRLIHDCQVDIFARNEDEKDELQNLIEDKLKDNPNFEEINFNQGFPLTETGELDSDFYNNIGKQLCPYCESDDIKYSAKDNCFECLNCGKTFTELYIKFVKKYLNVKEVDSRPILSTKATKKEKHRMLITFNLFELRYREF